jgi:hypothetical protein
MPANGDRLKKLLLLAILFFAGLVLVVYSWYASFPISASPNANLVFLEIYPLYWPGLVLLLISIYLFAVNTKSNLVSWAFTIGLVLIFFSLSFFFNLLPGSDCTYFRGLNQYFIKTDNLDTSQLSHGYYQWPAFFLLTKYVTSISSVPLYIFEFFQYSLIGILLITTLFIYAYRYWHDKRPTLVIAFFISSYFFFNYQDVPFSLAIALLFIILLILESKTKNLATFTTILLIFVCISLMHAFVPLFYIIYLLIRFIVKRSKWYSALLLLTSVIFFVTQITLASKAFLFNIALIFNRSDYSAVINHALNPISNPMDVIVQFFTRSTSVILLATCFVAFAVMLYNRKLRDVDKAIFLTGLIYTVLGFALYTLGTRAIPIALIPVCLGACYFFDHKTKRLRKILFVILLAFSVSLPMHLTLSNPPMLFQTNSDVLGANFVIENYNWSQYNRVLLDNGLMWYIYPQISGNSELVNVYSMEYKNEDLMGYNCIVFSTNLKNELLTANVSIENMSYSLMDYHNIIYNTMNICISEKIDF